MHVGSLTRGERYWRAASSWSEAMHIHGAAEEEQGRDEVREYEFKVGEKFNLTGLESDDGVHVCVSVSFPVCT